MAQAEPKDIVIDTPGVELEAAAPAPPSVIDQCWNRIGVHGDGSCVQLKTVVHCRNCPVYSEAGLELLNRPLSPEYRREWTEHFAREKQLAVPAKLSVLVFRVQTEWLALPAEVFQEVAEYRLIHSLPQRRRGIVLGLTNIRGELLICVSLGRLLGLESQAQHQHPCSPPARLLVAAWQGNRFVFPADEVHGTLRLQPQELQEPPATVARAQPTYSRGIFRWEQRTVGLLDRELLFPSLSRSLT